MDKCCFEGKILLMDTHSATANEKPGNVLSILEKVLELRYALLLISLLLAIEVARIPMNALGFPPFDWLAPQHSISLGSLLVFLAGYFFFMAGVSPLIQAVLEYFLSILNIQEWLQRKYGKTLDTSDAEDVYRLGYVFWFEAQNLALEQRDEFWAKRCEAHSERLRNMARTARFMSSVSFSCLLLIVWELSTADKTDVTRLAWRLLLDSNGEWAGPFPIIASLIFALSIIAPWWRQLLNGTTEYARLELVKHPELAKRLYEGIPKKSHQIK